MNKRQRDFAHHFVACGNAAEAARKAGYAEKSAPVQAHRLLGDQRVRSLIAELQSQAAADTLIDRDMLLRELKSILLGRISRYLTPTGDIDMEAIARYGGADIESIRVKETTRTRNGVTTVERGFHIKMRCPIRAADQICRMLGFDAQQPEAIEVKILPLEPWGAPRQNDNKC